MSKFEERHRRRQQDLEARRLIEKMHERDEARAHPGGYHQDAFHWSKGPGDVWLVAGLYERMKPLVDAGEPLKVVSRSGEITEVVVERLSTPNSFGNCYGHPVGTEADQQTKVELEPEGRTKRRLAEPDEAAVRGWSRDSARRAKQNRNRKSSARKRKAS